MAAERDALMEMRRRVEAGRLVLNLAVVIIDHVEVTKLLDVAEAARAQWEIDNLVAPITETDWMAVHRRLGIALRALRSEVAA